jgi:hypothetical protein
MKTRVVKATLSDGHKRISTHNFHISPPIYVIFCTDHLHMTMVSVSFVDIRAMKAAFYLMAWLLPVICIVINRFH